MVELFEHTADLGIRATAPTLESLFAELSRGLTMATVDAPDAVEARNSETFLIDGTDRDYLLFDLLREQLRRFEMDGLLTSRVDVTFTDSGLEVVYHGEPSEPGRHILSHEVKAITYHGLSIEQTPTGFAAEVIVDI